MPFDTDDESVKDSAPRDIYDFVVGTTHYRYTSAETAETFGGQSYTPAGVQRSALALVGAGDEPELVVTLDIATALAVLLLPGLPPQGLTVTARRIQPNGNIVMRSGKVVASRAQGRKLTLRIPTKTDDPMRGDLPGVYLSRHCQNTLFDEEHGGFCQAKRADHAVLQTLDTVNGNVLTLLGSTGTTDAYKGGEAIIGDEHRTIASNTGSTLTLLTPFEGLVGGESVTYYPSCNLSIEACVFYGEVRNFTGAPFLPEKNPFQDLLGFAGEV